MVTDLKNTGKRNWIYTKHKITTSENDNILLSDKETQSKMRRYSDSDSPYLPPKYTSKNSTPQSPKRTHPSNINDISSPQFSQDYDPITNNSTIQLSFYPKSPTWTNCSSQLNRKTSLGTSHNLQKSLKSLFRE